MWDLPARKIGASMPDSSILRHWWEAGYQPLYCLPNEHRVHVPRKGTTGSAPWPAVMPAPPAGAAYRPAVRLPAGVVALDVDCDRPEQPGKDGWSTLERMAATLGPLPATYRLTARGPFQRSGRYLFRVPAGVRLTDAPFTAAGGAVEVIRVDHRFSWAPGDIHPATGTAVVCYDPDGAPLPNNTLPHVSALPELPAVWYQDQQARELSTGPSPAVDRGAALSAEDKAWKEFVAHQPGDGGLRIALISWGRLAAGRLLVDGMGEGELAAALWAACETHPSWGLPEWLPGPTEEAIEYAVGKALESPPTIRATGVTEWDELYPTKARGVGEQPAPLPEAVGSGGWRLDLQRGSDTEFIVPEWLWEHDGVGRIPTRAVTLCAGKGGTGKSTFTLWLAAQLTRGTLPGMHQGTPRDVLIYGVEDAWDAVIAPRLAAAGADMDRVFAIKGLVDDAGNQLGMNWQNLEPLVNACADPALDVALLIVDPLITALPKGTNSNSDVDVTKLLLELAKVAEHSNIAIVGLAHVNKNSDSGLDNLLRGSGAWRDRIRALLLFIYDVENKKHLMGQNKNSYDRSDELSALEYRLDQVARLDAAGRQMTRARTGTSVVDSTFTLVGESTSTLADAADGQRRNQRAVEASEDLQWIAEALAAGPLPSRELEHLYSGQFDQSVQWPTLKGKMGKAKAHFETSPTMAGGGKGALGWSWRLTEAGFKAYGLSRIVDTEIPWTTPTAPPPT